MYKLINNDCLQAMKELEENTIDSIVTDPPYGISFLGKEWDHGVPGVEFWVETLRVAKPGAYLLAFGGTRTFHRLTVAIEDAGFEIRDCIMWVYGVGFPKSYNIGKHAEGWEGWGTALKPAWEPIIVARKPVEGSATDNVRKYGTGGMNIDACRVGTEEVATVGDKNKSTNGMYKGMDKIFTEKHIGRHPANFIHDGSEEVLQLFPESKTTPSKSTPKNSKPKYGGNSYNNSKTLNTSTTALNDQGSNARFFYSAKISSKDRNEGCQNNHPTVKPTDLMAYLCRLVTQPGGTVLDPFMGSGSTGKAAIREGFNFIGMDLDADYVEIARARIEFEKNKEKGSETNR